MPIRSISAVVLALGLTASLAGLSFAQVREANIVRDGTGATRSAYDALELKPFPADAWGKLSDFKGGAAPTPNDLAGKPVLIACFASWHEPSRRAWRNATRLSQQHAKDGLIVIGAHHPEGWAEAEAPQPAEGARVLVAHDAKGEFRKALRSSGEPSFFVIDRAGQLRFAGVATSAIADAVRLVSAESAQDASSLESRLQADAKAAERDSLRSTVIRGDVDLTSLPEVPFPDPPREAFEKARWPRFPQSPNQNQPTQDQARPAGLPDQGWYPSRPPTKGRAVVLYFWSQRYPATYEGVMQRMDVLARQLGRDGVVAGVMTNFRAQSDENTSNNTEQARDPREAATRFERMSESLRLDHPQIPDLDNALLSAMPSVEQNTYRLPYAAVISSDGVVRWAGHLEHPGFRGALDAVLREDPGIRARRAAEEAFIREQQKK
jgi:thiol-disulfide isomerase/thioredoxin